MDFRRARAVLVARRRPASRRCCASPSSAARWASSPARRLLAGVQELCRKHGVLFVLDEVSPVWAAPEHGWPPDRYASTGHSACWPKGSPPDTCRSALPSWLEGLPSHSGEGFPYVFRTHTSPATRRRAQRFLVNLDIPWMREKLVTGACTGRPCSPLLPLREHPLVADVPVGGAPRGVAFKEQTCRGVAWARRRRRDASCADWRKTRCRSSALRRPRGGDRRLAAGHSSAPLARLKR